MSSRTHLLRAALTASIALACAANTFAADTAKPDSPAPSKEMREKLAAAYEQMAACLRSDKAFAACREELAQSHAGMMHEMGCPGRKMRPNTTKRPPGADQK